jgi:protein phosphatase
MFTSFPLQTKHLQSLVSPWMTIGLCEVMNTKPRVNTAGFVFHNHHNTHSIHDSNNTEDQLRGTGATVGAGVFDSYEGSLCSQFVAAEFQTILSSHVTDLRKQRILLRNLPPHSPMAQALQTHHALRTTVNRQSGGTGAFVEGELVSMYSQFVDHAFFDRCRRELGPQWATSGVEQVGCRGAWFASTLQFDNNAQQRCVDVVAANVGDCRTFVIAANPRTNALKSELDPSRHRVAQLSMDHGPFREEDFGRIRLAGGVVDSEKNGVIDGHPHMNVARAFGYWCMKSNPNLSQLMQKVVSKPSVCPIRLFSGDVVVSLNFSCFETRSGELSFSDEVAKVVMESLGDGASPDEAAGAICDSAMAFGAHHSLIAAVAVVSPDLADLRQAVGDGQVSVASSVVPGPFHPNLVMTSAAWKEGMLADVNRCGILLDKWLELRYNALLPYVRASGKVKPLSSQLTKLFPHEMRVMRRQIQTELEFFDLECGPDFEKLSQRLLRPVK